VGLAIIIGLTWAGYNSASKSKISTEGAPHVEHNTPEKPISVSDSELPVGANLDEVVKSAVANLKKGQESGDMGLAMNEGVMKLLAVVKQDSNHLQATYYLGLFALESGQIEKAQKRFKKLVLLQPQNEEYKKILRDIELKLKK
jgi:hypothetical protein